ncbi:aminoglycoside phosphotransferase family protein [Pseudoduganella plicata]|uniref:3'-kinase n=1 Tax=Pseudoduganella plicata TaxID=321984 RepID=A0A4V1AU09_9BURK|nr:aminoglycoside phosphotransferase family protein [Pseudoduganella plicata]QBQ37528.1 3'-kinase [Pseudoduganella plicata]GGY90976.1 streptomycin 3''-phosphotransferase [Pseudoduganella plicata]
MSNLTLFDAYLRNWNAEPDGEPFATHSGHLLPVRLDGHPNGRPAMIKIARHVDERIGSQVMRWWDGDGAAHVYAYDEDDGVLLMERATGSAHLLNMALQGEDDAATRIVCRVISRLHAKRPSLPPGELLPLTRFFESLAPMARREGGLMAECSVVADELLGSQRERVVLHGDAHHSNILDFGERGWLAIDPKRVTGERYYDYVGVLCNPDLKTCIDPIRFAKQVDIVVDAARLERRRLLRWVMAHAALSAAWFLEDGERNEADNELAVARLARQALERAG